MDQNYITRKEYEEHSRRMDDEHRRINHRLEAAEKGIEENHKLLLSVEKLALNMEALQKEQKEQGERIAEMEARDGEAWRNVKGYIITTIIGAVLGFIFLQIGM